MPFRIIRNDITKVRADAIVNTANPNPVYGSGTDSAIYKAAGERELLAEREKIGRLREGEVAVTPAFRLKAKYIIHTSGPVWHDGNFGEYELLASCYRKSLQLARHLGCKSIAFPLISTGSYGFPRDKALDIALDQISSFLENEDMDITLVVFDRKTFNLSSELVQDVSQFIDENYVKGLLLEEYGRKSSDGRRRGQERPDGRKPGQERPDEKRRGQEKQSRRRLFSRADTGWTGSGAPLPKADGEYGETPSWESRDERETNVPGLDAADIQEMSTAFLEESPEEYTVSISDNYMAEEPAEDTFFLMESGDRESGGHGSEAAPSGSAPSAGKKKELRIERPADGHRRSLQDVISQVGESFQECLLRTIDEKGLTDTQVYKRANIDRKLFSKIRCNPGYSPSRRTVIALVIALELNMDEAVDMLRKAGMALSPGSKFDLIIAYCIQNKIYDIIRINALLFDYDQPLLGA